METYLQWNGLEINAVQDGGEISILRMAIIDPDQFQEFCYEEGLIGECPKCRSTGLLTIGECILDDVCPVCIGEDWRDDILTIPSIRKSLDEALSIAMDAEILEFRRTKGYRE